MCIEGNSWTALAVAAAAPARFQTHSPSPPHIHRIRVLQWPQSSPLKVLWVLGIVVLFGP